MLGYRSKKNIYIIVNSVVLFILLFQSAYSAERKIPAEVDSLIDFQARKYKNVLQIAYLYGIDSLDINKICDGAMSGLLQQFDKQSAYFSVQDIKKINETNAGSGASVGIDPVILNDSLVVAGIAEFSSADSNGVKKGDRIIFINGQKVVGKKLSELKAELAPKLGEKVELILKDPISGALKEKVLFSSEIPLPAITAYFMIKNTNIAYVYAKNFNAKSDSVFKEIALNLKKQGMEKLIFDLRGNPGGYVSQVSQIIDLFVPKGFTITKTNARDSAFLVKYETTSGGEFENIPIVVLVDENSASASEIFAGAMQDLDRGVVVGDITFGKGSVQNFWNFSDGSGFRLTVGKYTTPSGREIQKNSGLYNVNQDLDPTLKFNLDEKSYDNLLKSMQLTSGKMQLPIYKSRKGRTILGGGAIYPDFLIKSDTTTLLTKYWKQNGIFLEYALNYYVLNEKELNIKYKNNISAYLNDFNVSEDMLNQCAALGKAKNLWNEAMFRQDKQIILFNIKRYIAYAIRDEKGFDEARILGDKVFLKALEVMPNSEKMLNNF